jgi:hypothetical protein
MYDSQWKTLFRNTLSTHPCSFSDNICNCQYRQTIVEVSPLLLSFYPHVYDIHVYVISNSERLAKTSC